MAKNIYMAYTITWHMPNIHMAKGMETLFHSIFFYEKSPSILIE